MTARLALLGAVTLVAASRVAAEEGSWTLAAEAPILSGSVVPHEVRLRAISPRPPSDAIIRALSWSWAYPSSPAPVTARICVALRCLETGSGVVHGDETLSGTVLAVAPVMSVRLEGSGVGPVVGDPITMTIEWTRR